MPPPPAADYDPAEGLNDDHTGVIGSCNYGENCGGGWSGYTAVVEADVDRLDPV